MSDYPFLRSCFLMCDCLVDKCLQLLKEFQEKEDFVLPEQEVVYPSEAYGNEYLQVTGTNGMGTL